MSNPILQAAGSFTGSCIACLGGTDTAIAFRGEPEWCVAALVVLGLPTSEAVATFDLAHPDAPPY